MENLDIERLDEIYKKYNYEVKKDNRDYRVYVFKESMYHGADIIPLRQGVDLEKVRKEYSDSGYAVIPREYLTIDDVEDTLFDGFFQTESIKAKIYQSIKTKNNQTRLLGKFV